MFDRHSTDAQALLDRDVWSGQHQTTGDGRGGNQAGHAEAFSQCLGLHAGLDPAARDGRVLKRDDEIAEDPNLQGRVAPGQQPQRLLEQLHPLLVDATGMEGHPDAGAQTGPGGGRGQPHTVAEPECRIGRLEVGRAGDVHISARQLRRAEGQEQVDARPWFGGITQHLEGLPAQHDRLVVGGHLKRPGGGARLRKCAVRASSPAVPAASRVMRDLARPLRHRVTGTAFDRLGRGAVEPSQADRHRPVEQDLADRARREGQTTWGVGRLDEEVRSAPLFDHVDEQVLVLAGHVRQGLDSNSRPSTAAAASTR